MKKNTDKLKNYLKLAVQNTPDDFVFENIKPLLRSALAIVEKAEKKRENREIQNQQANINAYNININQYNNAINAIDKMIKEQEKNINNIKASKDSPSQDEILNG
jgi:septal ring factor EnvC (AmiA/AmiB activator)